MQLRNNQISSLSRQVALDYAHGVCTRLEQGMSVPDVAALVRSDNPALTDPGVAIFVHLSIVYYCPQYTVR
jgi:hypothetical protein